MKFAIIHNGLHDRHSHYYNEALGWIRMCRASSIDLRLYINKNAEASVIADTGGIPAFPYASDVALLNVDPVISDIHGLVEVGGAFARTLSQIEFGMLDVLVVPFASEKEVFGVAQWLGSLPASARPRVVFIFHQGSHNWTLDNGTTVRGNMSTYSYAAFRIRSVLPPQKIAFLATNPRLASVLSKVVGLPATVCPMPKNYVETDGSEQAKPPHAHLALVGEYRAEKGQSLIPEIISGFCQARPGRDVFIQVNAEKDLETFAKLELPNTTRLHSYVGQFSHSGYSRRLETIDLMLLPYDERRYWFRFSGIFSDALTFGVPTVVPARTRMAEVLQQGWGAGVEFADYSASSILEAVLAASDQVNTLKAKAQSRRTEWRQSQCIEALFGMILKWTDGKD